MANPSSRMLRLLSLLQTHRYWPGAELAERLEVSVRTLRRDVERLRELGYPVQAHRGVDGVSEASVRALAKVVPVMPPRLRRRVEALRTATVPAGWDGGPAVDPAVLTAIAQ